MVLVSISRLQKDLEIFVRIRAAEMPLICGPESAQDQHAAVVYALVYEKERPSAVPPAACPAWRCSFIQVQASRVWSPGLWAE